MTQQRWIFVDFDNTMMETERYVLPSLIERFNDLYGDQIDHQLTMDEFIDHFQGQTRQSFCQNLSAYFGITVDYPELYDAREWRVIQYMKTIPGGIPMAPGIIEMLTALQHDGFQCAFVSNNSIQRGLATMRFADNGRGNELARVFSTAYFEAGDVQKPLPGVYLRAIEQLGATPAQSCAIEDSVTGVTAAVAAGLPTFGYVGFADDVAETSAKLLHAGSLATFHHWPELPALLQMHLK